MIDNLRHNGAFIAVVDMLTMGLYLLFYMHFFQPELERVTGKKYRPYYQAYLLGLITLLIYPIYWISVIAEDLKIKAKELAIKEKTTSFQHMFFWNLFGMWPIFGAMIATKRFFDTYGMIVVKEHLF